MKNKKISGMLIACAVVVTVMSGCTSNTKTIQSTENTQSTEAMQASTDAVTAKDNEKTDENEGTLVIAKQGIFSAGGTTITSEGTFNPQEQWEETGACFII